MRSSVRGVFSGGAQDDAVFQALSDATLHRGIDLCRRHRDPILLGLLDVLAQVRGSAGHGVPLKQTKSPA